MGRKISSIEKEIDEIMLQIYEETKHMTRAEEREYYMRDARELAEKHGFRIISSLDEV